MSSASLPDRFLALLNALRPAPAVNARERLRVPRDDLAGLLHAAELLSYRGRLAAFAAPASSPNPTS